MECHSLRVTDGTGLEAQAEEIKVARLEVHSRGILNVRIHAIIMS